MNSITKIGIGVVLGIILASYVAYKFIQTNKEKNAYKDNFYTSQDAFNTYRIKAEKLSVVYQNQMVFKESELRKILKGNDSLKAVVKHYKDLSEVTTVVTQWKHDTIPVSVPIMISKDTTVALGDSCFKASLSVFKGGISLNNLSIQNKQDIVTGARKSGLFKTEYSFDIINSNPCISVTGMKSYKVVHKKSFFGSPLFLIPVGIIGGIVIHTQLIK